MQQESFTVRHVEYVSAHAFAPTVARFEAATGTFDGAAFVKDVNAADGAADFEARMRAYEGASGFMRFLDLDHGAWLTLYGVAAKCRAYLVGNPLIAATMLKYDIRAALNVPVRVLIRETSGGEVRLGYDLPSSLMSRLHNGQLTAAAENLDAKLAELILQVAGGDESHDRH